MAVDFGNIFKNSRAYFKGVNDLFMANKGCECKKTIEMMCLIAGCEKPLKVSKIAILLGYSYPTLEYYWVSMLRSRIIKRDKDGKHYFVKGRKSKSYLEQVSPFAKEWYSDMDRHFDLIALANAIQNWNGLRVPYSSRRQLVESLVFNDIKYCHPSIRNQAISDYQYLYENKEEFEIRFTAERAEIVSIFNAADRVKKKAN